LDLKKSISNTAVGSARNYVERATSVAKSTATSLASYIPSIRNLTDTLHLTEAAPLTLENVKALEEAERLRRIAQDGSYGLSQANARKVAFILKRQKFPFFSQSRKGSFKFANRLEERERKRRLANKDEAHLHQMNARKVSSLLSDLGWPFIRQSVSSRALSATLLLEEEERWRRVKEDPQNFTAITNARKVSSLIKAASHISNQAFMRTYTKRLEEKERKRRMSHSKHAIQNAHRVAQLFVSSSIPLVPPVEVREQNLEQESEERKHRIPDIEEQKRARKKARRLSSAVRNNNLEFEDRQRIKVLKDKEMRQLAQEAAESIASILSQDTDLLEETERRSRMHDQLAQLQSRTNANKASGMILAYYKNKESDNQLKEILSHPPSSFSSTTTTTSFENVHPNVNTVEKEKKIFGIRQLYDREMKLADKEKTKADALRNKSGLFRSLRLQMHDSSAKRHLEIATKCNAWLEVNDPSKTGMSATE